MENTRHNGLAGKARRARTLNRASRMHAQQMIEDYLYPEPLTRGPERIIPIRSRGEFLPSTAFAGVELAKPTPRRRELSVTGVPATLERVLPERPMKGVGIADAPPFDSVIRPPKAPIAPDRRRLQKQSPFTPGGFLYGCALGSAAAAVVLLVVQLAVG